MLSRMLGLIRGIGKRVALHPKTSSKKYPRQFRMFLEGQDGSSTSNVTPFDSYHGLDALGRGVVQ